MADTINLDKIFTFDDTSVDSDGGITITEPVTNISGDKPTRTNTDQTEVIDFPGPNPILVPEFKLDPEYVLTQERYDVIDSSFDIIVNVVDDVYVKQPDIRNINYPIELRGGDFLGYDVDFEISYESVNTTFVEIRVGDSDDIIISNQANGTLTFNVEDLFKRFPQFEGAYRNDRDEVAIPFSLTPVNNSGREPVRGKEERFTVNFDKGDLSIPRSVAINRIAEGFRRQLDRNDNAFEASKYLTHLLHIGGGDNRIISNWTDDDDSLIVKMYEPLPTTVQANDKVWISKLQSEPIVETVTITGEDVEYCPPLKGANFAIDPDNGIGFDMYNSLVASGSQTSTDLVNKYAQKVGIDTEKLNINYTSGSGYNFDSFAHFGSAEERFKNFYYKVQMLEAYDTEIEELPTGSNVNVTLQKERINERKNNLLRNFDGFETFLYEETGSLGYPKSGGDLVDSNGTIGRSWYNSVVELGSQYDKDNVDYLVNNLPMHVIRDSENEEFLLFMDMIGQHFDILWSYINALSRNKKLENKVDKGITNDLIYYMLESFGWDTEKAYDSQFLWEYAFGKYKDGDQKYNRSLKSANEEVWRRILNNLPYLLKHKGTKRSLKAIMSCYGVPESLLTIMEFGGPTDPSTDNTTRFSFEDTTAALVFNGSQQVNVPWKKIGTYPKTIELNVKFDSEKDHTIIGTDGGNAFELKAIQTTGSLGVIEFSPLETEPSLKTRTPEIKLFTDTYKNITVTNESNVFNIYVKEAVNDRLRTNVSASVIVTGSNGWDDGQETKINVGETLSGSIDEFRLWKTPLSESAITNHTFIPDAIDGNDYQASTEDLWFRLDFERPKNRAVDTDILNVAISDEYGETHATASNFPSIAEYPYNYVTYNRTVSGRVPSLGYGFSNKIRFEEQELVSDLSSKVRATKKSFDRAPIDSPRLGFFLSVSGELDKDIMRSFGDFNIDNYIGSPDDRYNNEYRELATLRDYYFQRITRNYKEYVNLVKYIDKSLFDSLENLVPSRAKVSKGLLIEPHILERAKVRWNRPESDRSGLETTIDNQDTTDILLEYNTYDGVLFYDEVAKTIAEYSVFSGTIEENDEIDLLADYVSFTSSINYQDTTQIVGTTPFYNGFIDAPTGGKLEALNIRQTNIEQQRAGFNLQEGFGLYASASHGKVTTVDSLGNRTGSRKQIYKIKEEFTEQVFTQVAGWPLTTNNEPVQYDYVPVIKTRYKITVQEFGATPPEVGGKVLEVKPLNGYFSTHYKNIVDLPEGLQRSYYKGSKQTAETTPDGLPPVQTFTTNPNVLKVADTGRGSGEPILEVD